MGAETIPRETSEAYEGYDMRQRRVNSASVEGRTSDIRTTQGIKCCHIGESLSMSHL